MKIEFNDKRGHRGRHHVNLIAARLPDGQQVIFQFNGRSVPGVAQIIKKDYNQNGKWSASYWEVDLVGDAIGFIRSQHWETGEWLNSRRWPEAIAEFTGRETLDADAVERFIRAAWRDIATELDAAAEQTRADGSIALADLLTAQKELAVAQAEHAAASAEVVRLEKAQAAHAEAEALKKRTARAKEAMKRGVDLADLKALLQ